MESFSVLMLLALIPPILLLIFIYFKDKKDKEPFWLLFILFLFGVISTLPAVIWELIATAIIGLGLDEDTIIYQIVLCFLIIGPAEEICKYFMLRAWTWKNKHFDYLFDGIVYSVFVSLGFAAFENILYVFSGGIGVAIMRMLTAIPGHTSFAVYMGYFYSKSKYCLVEGDKKGYKKNRNLSLIIPIIIHAIYDCLVMSANVIWDDTVKLFTILAWLGFVVVIFIGTFIFVNIMSKKDYCIAILDDNTTVIYKASNLGSWTCSCNSLNYANFCPRCGNKRPVIDSWFCTSCGAKSHWNFCGRCGMPKASIPSSVK